MHCDLDGTKMMIEEEPGGLEIYVRGEALLRWCEDVIPQVDPQLKIEDFLLSWKDGRAMCAMLSFYHPNWIDYSRLKSADFVTRIDKCNKCLEQVAF